MRRRRMSLQAYEKCKRERTSLCLFAVWWSVTELQTAMTVTVMEAHVFSKASSAGGRNKNKRTFPWAVSTTSCRSFAT